MVKVVAIIQARLSSSRLPAKVMLDLVGKTVLERVVDRVRLAKAVDEIWIATSTNNEDDIIEELAKRINIKCYRGSLDNVISRYYETAKLAEADVVVRITADNPLTEPSFIDVSVEEILKNSIDYVGFENIPIGTGVEAFTMKSFSELRSKNNLNKQNCEHVTSYYYQNPEEYNVEMINNIYSESKSNTRVTVDTLNDYIFMAEVYKEVIDKKINPRNFMDYILSKKKL